MRLPLFTAIVLIVLAAFVAGMCWYASDVEATPCRHCHKTPVPTCTPESTSTSTSTLTATAPSDTHTPTPEDTTTPSATTTPTATLTPVVLTVVVTVEVEVRRVIVVPPETGSGGFLMTTPRCTG